jgi:hypothetical protein
VPAGTPGDVPAPADRPATAQATDDSTPWGRLALGACAAALAAAGVIALARRRRAPRGSMAT